MDEVGVLTESFGLKQQGKLARMAAWKPPNNTTSARARNFASNSILDQNSSSYSSRSSQNSNSVNGYFFYDHETLYSSQKSLKFGGLDDGFDILVSSKITQGKRLRMALGLLLITIPYSLILITRVLNCHLMAIYWVGSTARIPFITMIFLGPLPLSRSKLHRLMTCLGPLAEKRRKPEWICRF
ncbi:uncharacterized protein LOC131171326 [Hevea brasiliensis]|uniref:uncharacterized protein LOC131171326 n=1 Tax=Hevea brasiliensis TaxID=3981 RepID=UPI0025F87CB5|nr:uncharacterized protein LOC131171326 [Hevea brasiliensis]